MSFIRLIFKLQKLHKFLNFFVGNYPLLKVFETGTGARWPLKQIEQQLDLSKLFNDDAFSKPHSFWVKSVAIELFKLFDGESLAKVASKQTQFAVSMIPLLVKALLMTKNSTYLQALNTAVNLFFLKNFAQISSESMEVMIRWKQTTNWEFRISELINCSTNQMHFSVFSFRLTIKRLNPHRTFISTKCQSNWCST